MTPREADSAAVQVAAARHVSEGAGGQVVAVNVQGCSLLVALEVDQAEHSRRAGLEIGAVCCRRLLHALWELPANVTWPCIGLDPADLAAFSDAVTGLVRSSPQSSRPGHPGRITSSHAAPAGPRERSHVVTRWPRHSSCNS
jgi:hypothetical protein